MRLCVEFGTTLLGDLSSGNCSRLSLCGGTRHSNGASRSGRSQFLVNGVEWLTAYDDVAWENVVDLEIYRGSVADRNSTWTEYRLCGERPTHQ